MRTLSVINTSTPNSLVKWYRIRNPLIVAFNFIIIFLSRFLPSFALKRFFLRLTGMKIGKNVSVSAMVYFDFFWPELIEIKDNSLIGFGCTILAHEFLISEYRTGKVIIEKNVLIGANSTVLAGITIEENSVVGAMSLVNSDVPAKTFFAGVPAKMIKKL